MDWQQWVLWLAGLLMDRWVEIAVGIVVIGIWRWLIGRKFDRQAADHKRQIDALAAAVADRSQTSPTVIVNVGDRGEHEPERVDHTSGDSDAVKINPGNGWRVARLILKAETANHMETLFNDFMSQPHRDREERVFAAYWVRASKLRCLNGQECWHQTALAAIKHERKTGDADFWKRTIAEVGEIFREVYGENVLSAGGTPSPWMSVTDFRSYDGYVDFELYEAACLWVGIEPHYPVQHPDAKRMLGQLRSAVRNHALNCTEISLFAIESPKDTSPIRRDDLLDYAAGIGDIPAFLAQEEI